MNLAESLAALKDLNSDDLDFSRAGEWPLIIKILACMVVALVVLGGAYWFFILDRESELASLQAKEATLKSQYQNKAHQVANLAAYKMQMAEMEESFGALLKQLPTDTEVPGLLEDVSSTGTNIGLDIEAITLRSEVSREFYVELPLQVKVRGGYHDLAAFVSGVAGLPRIVTLHDFEIKATKGGNVLDMTIDAKTYRYSGHGSK